jgi:dCMP deaminase
MASSLKRKHLKLWIDLCRRIAAVSNCPRGKFGAIIVDEESNTLVTSGYNGYLRGGSNLCGGLDECAREARKIQSGTYIEIGCVHAEMNAILNSARETVSTKDKVLFVNGEPCEMCAKFIVQAGIKRVYVIGNVYRRNGLSILRAHRVKVNVVGEGAGEAAKKDPSLGWVMAGAKTKGKK